MHVPPILGVFALWSLKWISRCHSQSVHQPQEFIKSSKCEREKKSQFHYTGCSIFDRHFIFSFTQIKSISRNWIDGHLKNNICILGVDFCACMQSFWDKSTPTLLPHQNQSNQFPEMLNFSFRSIYSKEINNRHFSMIEYLYHYRIQNIHLCCIHSGPFSKWKNAFMSLFYYLFFVNFCSMVNTLYLQWFFCEYIISVSVNCWM